MGANFGIFQDPELTQPFDTVRLAQVDITGELVEGTPEKVYVGNVGDSALKEIEVYLSGDGANHVQLAIDNDGEPGVWASPGESIKAYNTMLFPQEQFAFWTRAIYAFEDREGTFEFQFRIRAKSLGTL